MNYWVSESMELICEFERINGESKVLYNLVYYYYYYYEVAGSIPGTSTNFKCGLGLERGPPSLVRTIG